MNRACTTVCLLTASGCFVADGVGGGLPPAEQVEPMACDSLQTGQGDGTWYDADGYGACGFDPPDDREPLLIAAMNFDDWQGSLPCGACANVTGPDGRVTVRIVDLCPECVHGDLDLSPDAFERLAQLGDGRIPISWELVACETKGPITWQFSSGSNPWWVAIQVRNHRNQVASIQADTGAGWRQLARTDWNHFIAEEGLGEGPFRLRAIDVHGEIIVDDAVPLLEDAGVDGPTQFPSCE